MSVVRTSIFFMSVCLLWQGSPAEAASTPKEYEQIAGKLSKAMALYRSKNKTAERYDVIFRRDPMGALVDEQGRLASGLGLYNGLAVQGIVHSNDTILALINDEFFRQGDQVGPYKILEIRSDGLVAQREKDTLFIPLYPQSDGQK